MQPVLRFAPSPTGMLHIGNVRIALLNWLYARKFAGQYILRFDDTDTERSKPEYVKGIQEDLTWLGITHDVSLHQMDRLQEYEKAIQSLKTSGRLYPCYETPEELDFKRKRQLAQGKPPIYDRAALKLRDVDVQKYEAEGRTPHWRFLLTSEKVSWRDMIHGDLEFDGTKLSDPVLIRADGRPIYTLSSVVDDIDLGVTHVIRGDDHITNTAVQMMLVKALGQDPKRFTYGHLPLLTDPSGGGLSKRLGSLSIKSLRDQGIQPMAINSLLARLGSSEPIEAMAAMKELVAGFDLSKFAKSPVKFSTEDLEKINAKLIHEMPFSKAQELLKGIGLDDIDASFWDLIKANLTQIQEVKDWWVVINAEIKPEIDPEDEDYVKEALELLPTDAWTEETWSLWTEALKEKTGRKGKKLFMPLRKALTGLSHGPEMKGFLPLIGRDRAEKRLKGEQA